MAGSWRQHTWRWQSNQGIYWLEDSFLMDSGMVQQGFSGRLGGVSLPPYDSLNLSYSSGDEIGAIQENRRRLALACDFSLESWSGLRQVHGTRIELITKAQAGLGVLDPEPALLKADGQITAEPGITLVTQHADCIPLYFADPVNGAIGLAHGGWQGTLRNIAGAMVKAMADRLGSKPADLLVSIGPGAGPCHYEVDKPVLDQAELCFAKVPRALDKILRPSPLAGRAYLNLWQANAILLEESGILPQHISIAGICTICENQRLFSHRRGDRGRQVAFIDLRQK
ncbi:MAG: peptidoglycan editing factor PgeF [Clostridiales bacterium]